MATVPPCWCTHPSGRVNSAAVASPRNDRNPRRGHRLGVLLLTAVLVGLAGLAVADPWGWFVVAPRAPATHVGRAACAACHPTETAAFLGSHHDLAMQPPTAASVLGDFADSSFTHFGATTTFTRSGERFLVQTDGPDGRRRDYPVAQVFGVAPLQQYLLDIGRGRLQALTIAWDTRPAAQGGQRWFHLYPDAPTPPGDELHWTGIQQNWNFMCAECHSTNLRRGYDAAADRFATTWSEIDVSCEACHGPASWHVRWANGEPGCSDLGTVPGRGLLVAFDERRGVAWGTDPATGLPVRSAPRSTQKELDTCARCHSRRSGFAEDFVPGRPLLDTHWPELLTEGLYHPDGQMLGEVYNYQSFLQSRMAQAGVTCSDCHDPHSGRPRGSGNSVCLQCHDARFDTPAHHFHAAGTAAAQCVACHAPVVTYMGVDPRHDHRFGVPRPDLGERFGVPDACTGCHTEQGPAWATQQLTRWYGSPRADHAPWTEAFVAARANRPDAEDLLRRIAGDPALPGIVRATALHEMPPPPDAAAAQVALAAAADRDPLLRWTAAEALQAAPAALRVALRPLLHDPVRAVRMAAARGLVGEAAGDWPAVDVQARAAGLAEYAAGQLLYADRPEARMNLGNLARDQGRHAAAEVEFRTALRLHPRFVAAYVNLADLCREAGREADCERTLRAGLAAVPGSADLLHALGLCLVRQQNLAEGVRLFGEAVQAAPAAPRLAYVYAVALTAAGRGTDALAALAAARARLPEARDLLELQVDCLVQHGELDQARARARDYVQRWPATPAAQRWRESLLR